MSFILRGRFIQGDVVECKGIYYEVCFSDRLPIFGWVYSIKNSKSKYVGVLESELWPTNSWEKTKFLLKGY